MLALFKGPKGLPCDAGPTMDPLGELLGDALGSALGVPASGEASASCMGARGLGWGVGRCWFMISSEPCMQLCQHVILACFASHSAVAALC